MIKNSVKRGLKWAALGACASSMAWAVHAEDLTPLDAKSSAVLASRAIDTASSLADLLDVSKEALGPEPAMELALARAKEIAPKPTRGMGAWQSGPGGMVLASVEEPLLCRALMDQCRAKAPSEPNICACKPDKGGSFIFGMRIIPQGGQSAVEQQAQ
jgi:hypothetical protein